MLLWVWSRDPGVSVSSSRFPVSVYRVFCVGVKASSRRPYVLFRRPDGRERGSSASSSLPHRRRRPVLVVLVPQSSTQAVSASSLLSASAGAFNDACLLLSALFWPVCECVSLSLSLPLLHFD